jgi:UbiD family decarboxylase
VDVADDVAGSARSYPDLRDHLKALEAAGLLLTVDVPINKDTELHPLVRWQFRGGIPEEARKAFLFTNVTDSKGKVYDMPVVVGAMAASPRVYSVGMDCPLEQLTEKWVQAFNRPIRPVEVTEAPCQEIVIEGPGLDVPGQALDALPVPISTPGWDNAPYLTNANFITRDPDTGVQNVGNYRGHIKAPRRLGMNTSIELRTGGYIHWKKYKALGKPMPCAVAVGGPPAVQYAAVQKVPEALDELAVAGGLVGAPINVVRCRTVDILVPAEAEIVIEGYVSTEYLEPEGPFGESHGYVNLQEFNGVMEVTCITRRRDAIFSSFISQVSPSESSGIRRPAHTMVFLQHLRDVLGIKGVIKVSLHEPLTNIRKVCIIQLQRDVPTTEVWRALYGAASLQRASGKLVIAVNEDIDPDNADALLWALAFRSKPHLDMQIIEHKDGGHGPRDHTRGSEDSALLVDATLKQDFPPVSLPRQEFMERARDIWENTLGLQKLRPESPWFGYSLGAWSEELERQAEMAVRGDYWETGKVLGQRRRSDVEMNTELGQGGDVDSD